MSEFESNCESEITCPYCNHSTTDSLERGDYGEEECDECGKKYHWSRDETVEYRATPDCKLNGQEHILKEYPGVAGALFCEVCDKYVPVKKEAI